MGECKMGEVLRKGKIAREASYKLVHVTTNEKNEALAKIAEQLRKDASFILAENEKDLAEGKKKGLSDAVLDRILLTNERIENMANAISDLQQLRDPIGDLLESIEKENGLVIQKKRVPLGVIAMIYEARPNVTIDAATLAIKTNNAVILRGSSSAQNSNLALVQTIQAALKESAVPVNAVQLIEDTSRETAKQLFTLNEYIDVLIPRGGQGLIQTVIRESTVPVIETGAGNCHTYIDEEADENMATRIVLNAKIQRPSVCNAVETVLVHKKWFQQYGEALIQQLEQEGVQVFGDAEAIASSSTVQPLQNNDWASEFLDLQLRVKVVDSVEEAITHIQQFGTKHSEAIITNNNITANRFLQSVDASAVYHNASTRFTDGFEFGYGAEIGISTQKLHARGPMGLEALTSTKFVISGTGQIRQ